MRLLLFLLIPSLAVAGEFHRLHAEQATATSFLQSNWNKYQENYHPNYVLDDDPKTAWVEGAEGDGVGESLTIPLSDLKTARTVRLVLFNGYQKSAVLLTANAAPQQLGVIVHGPGGVESARQELTLARKMGPQSFDIPVKQGVADVVLTLKSVHRGSKYRDTCISDVQVFVDSDVPYKAAIEQGKHEALLRWKKERLTTAKYYASLPKGYPFASAHFEKKISSKDLDQLFVPNSDPNNPEWVKNKEFVPLRQRLLQEPPLGALSDEDVELYRELDTLVDVGGPETGPWYTRARREHKLVPPENFSVPEAVLPLFSWGEEKLVKASGSGTRPVAESDTAEEEDFGSVGTYSNLLVLEGSAKDVKKLYFISTYVISERTTTQEMDYVIARLEGGRPTRVVTLNMEGSDVRKTTTVTVLVPTYIGDKLSRLETTTFTDTSASEVPETCLEKEPCTWLGISQDQTTLTAQTRP